MTPNDEIRLGGALFDLAHAIETKHGLAGVRYMKRWCIEKLPEKAFARGHFEAQVEDDGMPTEAEIAGVGTGL